MQASIQNRIFFGLAVLLATTVVEPLRAIPRLDLTGYPQPIAGQQRWVIQLPGLLPKSPDPVLSTNPVDWRVQLIVGRTIQLDCNQHDLAGQGLRMEQLQGSDQRMLYSVAGAVKVMSTRMACPPDEPMRESFLVLGSKPYFVPYNASFPIVVDVPRGFEVRWRLWKAEITQREATKL